MLIYRPEDITFMFITENLKDEGKKGVGFPRHADFTVVILNGKLTLRNC